MFRALAVALTLLASLVVATSGAQALVVSDQGNTYGVALVPGTRGDLAKAGTPAVTSSAPCQDPWLAPDLRGPGLPNAGLCYHGGAVMHGNETFAMTWDPNRTYWATTRNYVEQYLRDVADGSGTLSSPYAVTGQYRDAGGRAANDSLYGGGCIDYGFVGGSACRFPNAIKTGAGRDYPASDCPVPPTSNNTCLTDDKLKIELTNMITDMQLVNHIQPGHTPLLVLLTPPGVETCFDSSGKLCSANSASTAQFCSYHSHLNVGGTEFAYVVQPWTAGTSCDDLNVSSGAIDVGSQLVSPLSQAQNAAIVNPWLNGWSGLDGSEINDNGGCGPIESASVAVGSSSYFLPPQFSNAGVLESEPNAPACALGVALAPRFVVPSPIDQGDVVAFDGSVTVSSLMVPNAGYQWNFGDGKTAVGPSVVQTYAKGGTYAVKLTVTDRGGNVRSLSQTIVVLGPDGKPVSPPVALTPGLQARLQLMPQGLRAMLHSGLAIRVRSNKAANGIVTLSVPREAARRAHIRTGRGKAVVIGRGSFSGIKAGTVTLHLRLSRTTAAKLRRLGHVTVTIRLVLVAASGEHVAIDAAGRY
jgi:hypothetical protein